MASNEGITAGVEGGAGEAATLLEFLGYMRAGVIRNATDVPDTVASRPGVPSGTSLAWLVRHLTVSERFWFCRTAINDWRVASRPPPGHTIDDLITDYRQSSHDADLVIASWTDLDQVIETPAPGPSCTARWVLQHMITETARHAGHADILREQTDGLIGR